MEQPQISKSEDCNCITREEVKILINRYEEKLKVQNNRISHLQKDVAMCKASGLANKRQIDALYNIQSHGKPY